MYELRLSNEANLPGFMSFTERTRILSLDSATLADEGNYTIKVYALLLNG